MSLSKEELESVLMYSRQRINKPDDISEFDVTQELLDKTYDRDNSMIGLDIPNICLFDELIKEQMSKLVQEQDVAITVTEYIHGPLSIKKLGYLLHQKRFVLIMLCTVIIFWFNGLIFGAASCGVSKGRFVNPILNAFNQYFLSTEGSNAYRAIV